MYVCSIIITDLCISSSGWPDCESDTPYSSAVVFIIAEVGYRLLEIYVFLVMMNRISRLRKMVANWREGERERGSN